MTTTFVNNTIKIGYLSSQIKSTFFANSSHPTLLKICCKNLKWFSSNIYLMPPWLQICPIIITQFMFPSWSTRDFKSDQKSLNINHHIFDRGSLLILGQSNLHTQLRYKFGYFCKEISHFDRQPLMQLNMADKSKTLSLHFFFTKIPIGYNNCPRLVWRHEDASSSATARHENMREKQIIHGWFVNILPLQLHHIPNVPLLFTQRLYCGKRH